MLNSILKFCEFVENTKSLDLWSCLCSETKYALIQMLDYYHYVLMYLAQICVFFLFSILLNMNKIITYVNHSFTTFIRAKKFIIWKHSFKFRAFYTLTNGKFRVVTDTSNLKWKIREQRRKQNKKTKNEWWWS